MEQLITRLDTVLLSPRWQIGNAIGTLIDRALRRPRTRLAADRIRKICTEFSAWKADVLAAPAPNEFSQGELRQLDQWIDELGEAWASLLKSRRWELGCMIVEFMRGSQRRNMTSNSFAHIDEIIWRYNKIRHDFPEIRHTDNAKFANPGIRRNIELTESTQPNHEPNLYEQYLILRSLEANNYSWSERLLEYEKHWRETALKYVEASKHDQVKAHQFFHIGFAWEKCGQWREAAHAYECAIQLDPTQPIWFYRLANAYEWKERWSDAADLYEKALELNPAQPSWFYRLGRAKEYTPNPGVRFHHDIGLRSVMQGDWPAACSAYLAAIGIDNEQPYYHFRCAKVWEEMGDLKKSVRSCEKAIDLDPKETRWLEHLGHLRKRCLDFAGARDTYRRLLAIKPDHSRAQMDLYLVNVKLCRWAEAFEYTLRLNGQQVLPRLKAVVAKARYPKVSAVKKLRTIFENEKVSIAQTDAADLLREVQAKNFTGRLPVNWWFTLHLRLKKIGWYSLAYQAKDIAASLIASGSVKLSRVGITNYLEVAKAHFYLGRAEKAINHLQPILEGAIGDEEAKVAAIRLAADIYAFRGDFTRHRDALRIHERVNLPQAEKIFGDMIANRSIAIVGPMFEGRYNGKEIDSYDVIIRTNYVASSPQSERIFAAQGSRTDISYFSNFVSQELFSEIREAVDSRCIRMAVMPPSAYSYGRQHLSEPGDLRYNPGEPTAHLRAMSFAIQRIVHDIFRYNPSSVKVFNIDFFITSADYKKNYRVAELLAEIDQIYLGSSHDYRKDFTFMKCLRDQSIISGDDIVESLLDHTPEEYLAKLDQSQESITTNVFN